MEPLDDFENRPSQNSTIRGHIFFFTALLFALWFFITSWIWVYLANLFFSYPIGALSLIIWSFGRNSDPNSERYKFISWILICGLMLSFIALFLILAFDR